MLNKEKLKESRKQLERILDYLRQSLVFVEGKKDKKALAVFGINDVLTVSGNLRLSCSSAARRNVQNVVILTDRDERGDELAKEAVGELAEYGIKSDVETRRNIGRILDMKNIENMENKYRKFKELEK